MRIALKYNLLSTLLVALLLAPLVPFVFAQESEQFTVGLNVIGNDVVAPTVPTGLTATAVSSTQINLSWSASTDNLAVTGYNIFRDNLLIASTSATTYADAGLTPETLYAYNVSAFDAAGNESARSATATAQTLGLTVPQAPGGSPAPTPEVPVIEDVQVALEQRSATITWHTDLLTRAKVYWGLTRDLEGGVIQQVSFLTDHLANLTSLSPSTRYFFRIEVETQSGKMARSDILEFTTQALPDTTPPTNVSDFLATARIEDIVLTWKNPRLSDFDSVRILKSDTFYPTDLFDGELIYEGSGETYVDDTVVIGRTYYYTLFAKDTEGNFSSGVVAHARITPRGEPPVEPGVIPKIPLEELPDATNVHPDIAKLTWADFIFLQDGVVLNQNTNQRIFIDGTKNLTILLKYDKVPQLLKTIAVALHHPNDPSQVFTFLLRVDKEKEAYKAEIAPLYESGEFAANIVVVDFKNQALKRLSGSLIASLEALREESTEEGAFSWKMLCSCLIAFLLFLNALLLLALLWRRKKKEKVDATMNIEKRTP